MSKKFKFDICVCGHSFKDIIYEIDDFPKENSNRSYNAVVSYKFGGVFNTLRALRFLNKKIKIKVATILGEDSEGAEALKEIKKIKIDHQAIIFKNSMNTSLNIINKKKNTKTFIVQFNSQKVKYNNQIDDSNWIHFMYLDNLEFVNQFRKLVLNKNPGQFFSADLSRRSISKLDLTKYLNKIDFLICSTKELPSLFKSKKCIEFNNYSLNNLEKLSKKIPYIIVHNKNKSIGYIKGKKIRVINKKLVSDKNIKITGAGDTYTASLIEHFINKKMIDNRSIISAHRFASNFCRGKVNI